MPHPEGPNSAKSSPCSTFSETSSTAAVAPNRFETVKKALEARKLKLVDAEISMRPSNTVRLEGEQAKKVLALVEALEDLDDVQKVHANFDVPEEVLETA